MDLRLRAALRREPGEQGRELFQDAFRACWQGRAEADGFNRLVLAAGLSWRQVSVLRAYARWLRQAGTPFSQEYVEDTVLRHCSVARTLVELFEARFDPGAHDLPADGESRMAKIAELTRGGSQRAGRGGEPRPRPDPARVRHRDQRHRAHQLLRARRRRRRPSYVSLKLEPRTIDDLPEPRPRYEVFVYSPRVEGVHLRFGHVARGGLRWSDRREDFRTEVLGLVKAQMVKNAVIVPVGAKGGFYAKQLPDPAADREAWLAEGVGLLPHLHLAGCSTSPTTSIASRWSRRRGSSGTTATTPTSWWRPTRARRPSPTSPTRSPTSYGFWLGDAFASGGSAGYDHKAMGITARGAWESVQAALPRDGRRLPDRGLHLRRRSATCPATCSATGCCCREHTRLVAAFDHRHVFVDPDPDAADLVRRAASGCSTCRGRAGPTTTPT